MNKRILSQNVKNTLLLIAKENIDNLYSDKAIEILTKDKQKVIGKLNKDLIKKQEYLIDQLPEGIYTKTSEIINVIKNSIKRIDNESLDYSPLVLSFKEFTCCKLMKYNKGNIITGRDKEIEDILLTLCKKGKRGTILVGEPGTGKTAIVNAINARLIQRTVPRQLIGCQIFNLDIPYIFSKYKEDPFGTIIKVLEKASEYDKAILFIDEVHQLLGQKMNDILKPYLTEKIRFIGSTTINEYHSIITDDSALERRFTLIHVLEPSVEQTVNMVTNTKSVFEEHHKCIIPNDICRYLVENGSRFLGHRKNPDKSLDLLDIACSIMYEKEIKTEIMKIKPSGNYISDLENESNKIKSAKIIATNRVLSEKYINLAISSITGIPYDEIKNSLNYDEVKDDLNAKIINQKEPISLISNVVNIFKYIKSDRTKPISILLMVGPSGCGKRTVAKYLAKNLFGKEEYFIDYDMSAFGDSFRLSELRGSPPGYVGYGKSGGLIKKIRNMPQSVVFFRGINKAHEDIQQYILDACRTGKMIDSAEREASLNNTVIIFSVTLDNTQQDQIKRSSRGMGFGKKEEEKDTTTQALEKFINTNIIKSVDEIIQFNELTKDDLKHIYNLNKDEYINTYKVDIDLNKLEEIVLSEAKNGHDVISRLSTQVPKLVFQKLSTLKEKSNEKK